MPVKCFFVLNNQPMSMLFCPGVGTLPAFSGKPAYVDNPAATAVAETGPLPKGTYYIVNRESGGRMGWLRDWLKDRASHVHHDEWFALYRNDSVVDDYTFVNGVKRGNFRLHPNGRFGISEGCITLASKSQFDKLRQFLLSQDTKTVPGTTIKYYGTVEVQ
ncbi:DUF2778 domain-containing protein [Trinickia sp. LjRoot230]|uniref:DUF2778 domain-containing protein n=1 Tax=Trinickia sp. LjRoot230 TaxID=3342288 RepID=UPI003ECFC73E